MAIALFMWPLTNTPTHRHLLRVFIDGGGADERRRGKEREANGVSIVRHDEN